MRLSFFLNRFFGTSILITVKKRDIDSTPKVHGQSSNLNGKTKATIAVAHSDSACSSSNAPSVHEQ